MSRPLPSTPGNKPSRPQANDAPSPNFLLDQQAYIGRHVNRANNQQTDYTQMNMQNFRVPSPGYSGHASPGYANQNNRVLGSPSDQPSGMRPHIGQQQMPSPASMNIQQVYGNGLRGQNDAFLTPMNYAYTWQHGHPSNNATHSYLGHVDGRLGGNTPTSSNVLRSQSQSRERLGPEFALLSSSQQYNGLVNSIGAPIHFSEEVMQPRLQHSPPNPGYGQRAQGDQQTQGQIRRFATPGNENQSHVQPSSHAPNTNHLPSRSSHSVVSTGLLPSPNLMSMQSTLNQTRGSYGPGSPGHYPIEQAHRSPNALGSPFHPNQSMMQPRGLNFVGNHNQQVGINQFYGQAYNMAGFHQRPHAYQTNVQQSPGHPVQSPQAYNNHVHNRNPAFQSLDHSNHSNVWQSAGTSTTNASQFHLGQGIEPHRLVSNDSPPATTGFDEQMYHNQSTDQIRQYRSPSYLSSSEISVSSSSMDSRPDSDQHYTPDLSEDHGADNFSDPHQNLDSIFNNALDRIPQHETPNTPSSNRRSLSSDVVPLQTSPSFTSSNTGFRHHDHDAMTSAVAPAPTAFTHPTPYVNPANLHNHPPFQIPSSQESDDVVVPYDAMDVDTPVPQQHHSVPASAQPSDLFPNTSQAIEEDIFATVSEPGSPIVPEQSQGLSSEVTGNVEDLPRAPEPEFMTEERAEVEFLLGYMEEKYRGAVNGEEAGGSAYVSGDGWC